MNTFRWRYLWHICIWLFRRENTFAISQQFDIPDQEKWDKKMGNWMAERMMMGEQVINTPKSVLMVSKASIPCTAPLPVARTIWEAAE